eukprot:scaffold19815_cov58-Attheya_sp.AAC.3
MPGFQTILVLSSLVTTLFDHAIAKNMNGAPGQYKIANSDTFDTDYGDEREYFDVYSKPIKTVYSQVHWIDHGDIPLPEDIVTRFTDGTIMAVTGYEVDQVRMTDSGDEIPVPVTWAYPHHYEAFLLNSKKSRLVKKKVTDATAKLGMSHGGDEHWMAEVFGVEDDSSTLEIPQVHFFSEGNGGEMRMSYHGYPKNYAQVIESPDTFHIIPMQIDTWNRNMKNATYLPGPLPQSSRIPPEAGYNGLLECPCTDRLPKEWAMTYTLADTGNCTSRVQNATECFAATKQIIPSDQYHIKTVVDEFLPSGCSVSLGEDGSANSYWNTYTMEKESAISSNEDTKVAGVALDVVNLTVSMAAMDSTDAVQIKMTAPADKWFGVGFGSDSMCIHMQADQCATGGPYAIIVSGDTVTERKLDYHGPGSVLTASLTVESNEVRNGIRTVRLSRSFKGKSDKHYTFHPAVSSVKVIMAKGCGLEFSQHCGHGPNELNLLPVDVPTEICQAGIEGTIGGNKFDNNRCPAFPASDLLDQNNPTCHVQTYMGGLNCCRHGMLLLDQDQETPWQDQSLEYRLKFRFYFEEYKPAPPNSSESPSHQNLIRLGWATDAGEYDIIQCQDGVPPSQCVQVLTSRSKVRDIVHDCKIHDASYCTGKGSANETKTAGVKLIYAGPHCHAPTCLSMDLYNADTGRLICHVEPIHGQSHKVYDEQGFIQIPPCLWGDAAEGLVEPELLSLDTTLLSIKRNNNTLPHTGDMALWQMRGVVVPNRETPSTPSARRPFVDPQEVTSRPLLRHASAGERESH